MFLRVLVIDMHRKLEKNVVTKLVIRLFSGFLGILRTRTIIPLHA